MDQKVVQSYLDRVIALGGRPQPPCSEEEIKELRTRARAELSAGLPDEYADFLKVTNGLNFNGVFIYPSRTTPIAAKPGAEMYGFVEENLTWREFVDRQGNYLFYADSDLNLWGYNLTKSRHELRAKDCDDVEEVYRSFDEMLTAALRCSVET
jgi:hypothetical protein